MVNVEDSSYYSNESVKHIRAIVRNAYQFVSLEEISSTLNLENLTKEEAIAATQIAIWKYANSANVPDNFVNGQQEFTIKEGQAESVSLLFTI